MTEAERTAATGQPPTRTAAHTRALPAPSVLTNLAIVVKCGARSLQSAMKVTCSWKACQN